MIIHMQASPFYMRQTWISIKIVQIVEPVITGPTIISTDQSHLSVKPVPQTCFHSNHPCDFSPRNLNLLSQANLPAYFFVRCYWMIPPHSNQCSNLAILHTHRGLKSPLPAELVGQENQLCDCLKAKAKAIILYNL